jgi:hypothetical protein
VSVIFIPFALFLYFLYPHIVGSANFEFGGIICAHLFLIIDECRLVLNQTPFFMFVKLLALLISNIFSCFQCFVICRSLHQYMAKRGKMDLKRSNGAPASALDRTWCD